MKLKMAGGVLLAGGVAVALSDELQQAMWGSWRFCTTICTMARIAADYKYTWWKYPDDNPDHDHQTSDLHLRSARTLLHLFQTQKGLYIKVGQYLSSMQHGLPREYINTLRVLQDQAPTIPYELVEKVFREDFGGKLPHEVFAHFETTPLASASLAQVHKALTHEGEEVAVKVQYPNLRKDFVVDMFTHQVVLEAAGWIFKGWNLGWMHGELYDSLAKELDFENEAHNAEATARFFRSLNNTRVHVPAIDWRYTTKRVLTMEFIYGVKITEREQIQKMGIDPAAAVTLALEAMSQQIFWFGFVHCDPHPGNLFISRMPKKTKKARVKASAMNQQGRLSSKDDVAESSHQHNDFRLVILDHGLYRELREQTRLDYCQLWRSLVLQDDEKVQRYSKALGVEEWELFALVVLMRPYKTLPQSGRIKISPGKLQQMQKDLMKQVDIVFDMMEKMPRELLLVMRNQNYLRALAYEYKGQVNRFRIMARVASKGVDFRRPSFGDRRPTPSPSLAPSPSPSLSLSLSLSLSSLASWFRALVYSLRFEVGLWYSDVRYWLSTLAMAYAAPRLVAELEPEFEFTDSGMIEKHGGSA